MTLPDREGPAACEPEAVREGRPGTDRLIIVGDIRALFKLVWAAAHEVTRRPGFRSCPGFPSLPSLAGQ